MQAKYFRQLLNSGRSIEWIVAHFPRSAKSLLQSDLISLQLKTYIAHALAQQKNDR